MKIASLAFETTNLVNKEIETSVHSLLFDIKCPTNSPANTLIDALQLMNESFGATSLTLTRESGSETTTLQAKILLAHIAEMSANNGGMIRVDADGLNSARIRFTVELSNDGAFRLDDNSKIILNIERKLPNVSMDIYALDTPTEATTVLKYDKKYLNSSVEKDLDTMATDVFCAKVDNIDVIKLFYNNGKQVTMTVEELKIRLLDSQDPIIVSNGNTYYGYGSMACINVQDCWKISVTMSNSDTVYIVKTVNI